MTPAGTMAVTRPLHEFAHGGRGVSEREPASTFQPHMKPRALSSLSSGAPHQHTHLHASHRQWSLKHRAFWLQPVISSRTWHVSVAHVQGTSEIKPVTSLQKHSSVERILLSTSDSEHSVERSFGDCPGASRRPRHQFIDSGIDAYWSLTPCIRLARVSGGRRTFQQDTSLPGCS